MSRFNHCFDCGKPEAVAVRLVECECCGEMFCEECMRGINMCDCCREDSA